ncbi:hypothetical protein [Dyadobacter pollutisoli]|jgi:hypothetical protein|uniref:Uncharacterized protein n=1 Tax=Dyadobacter pollutisoli TaxID=2910158 RepID=A0A9E8N8E9_9BACT|nr:hypothetical protein [Dyadobacter pollutisoli]WAC10431.1 hypothetical protein ON006_22080 [Dyadobacter pollutisoli]
MKKILLVSILATEIFWSCSKHDSADYSGTIADLTVNYRHIYQSILQDSSVHEEITWKIKRVDVNKIEIEEVIVDLLTNHIIRQSTYRNVIPIMDENGHNFLDFDNAATSYNNEQVVKGKAALFARTLVADVSIKTKENGIRKDNREFVVIEF